MRCCKDLGIASELWDPRFIRKFMAEMAKETIVEHVMTKKRRKHFMRKDDEVKYPFKDISPLSDPTAKNAYVQARAPGVPKPGVASAASQAFQKAKTDAAAAKANPSASTNSTSSSTATNATSSSTATNATKS
jgi:hypothetical protein